jgi:phasin
MRKSSSKRDKAHDTHRKAASKNKSRKATRKITAENGRGSHPTAALTVARDQMHDAHRFFADQFEEFRDAQVPATLRDLAETNIAQTREVYERSKDTLQAVLASWQKSFGAANQGAVALNLKIMDITERNISTGFDLATGLAGARNLTEVIELQSAYWRKQLSRLQTQAEELRALSTRITANVTEPIESEIARAGAKTSRRKFLG